MLTEYVDGKRVRTYEAEDFIVVIGRYIGNLEQRAAEEDPWTLGEMERLRNELDATIVRTVARLRKAGYTWDAIGFNLKISPQTAWKRYEPKIRDMEV